MQFQARVIGLNRTRYKKHQSFMPFFLVIVADPIIQLKGAVISFAGLIGIVLPVDFPVANDIIRLNDPWDITQTRTIFQGILLFVSATCINVSAMQFINFFPITRPTLVLYSSRGEIIRWSQGNAESNRGFDLRKRTAMQIQLIRPCILFIFLSNINLHLP